MAFHGYDGRTVQVFIRFDRYRNYAPAPFKGAGRPVVVGGRWKVRKLLAGETRWRAWSDGKAKIYSKSLRTHAEAMKYASLMAQLHQSSLPYEQTRELVYAALPDMDYMRRAELIVNFSRFPKPKGAE